MKNVLKAVVTLALAVCIPAAALAAPAEWPKNWSLA